MVEDEVFSVLAPLVETHDAELIEVEFKGGLLKLVVDAEGGVGSDTLGKINRMSFAVIEQQELIKSNFSLEVSSPGLERKLVTPNHFKHAIGLTVSIRLSTQEAPTRIEGELIAADDDQIIVAATEVDDVAADEKVEIAFSDIAKARTVFNWREALNQKEKPRKTKKKKRKGSGR